ncbi:unnamed protein product [Amoebophrya sp. A25]|nr:unnamed protein product [Amoebophrya sp. A25]|eukprot:GSA25T00012475001.1
MTVPCGEAPPLFGQDEDEIVGIEDSQRDEYQNLAQERRAHRQEREQFEDERIGGKIGGASSANNKNNCKLKFLQPRKEKRFKIYFKYEGRRGPQCYLKVRLPKHGGYEDGPSLGIKRFFVSQYNKLREMLSEHGCHLRSELGIAIPDTDAISGYIGYGGLIYVVDGSGPLKGAEDDVYFWGHSTFSKSSGDAPQKMLTLSHKRIAQISVGTEHAAAVTEGGRVFTWGRNDFGQLGTGDEQDRPLPILAELPYEVYVSQLACGGRYTLALEKKGNIWSWGRFQASNFPRNFVDTWCNGFVKKPADGAEGATPSTSSTGIGLSGRKIVKVAAGDMHMAALTKEGEAFTWGYNDYGQLGWGLSGVDRTGQQKPTQVKGLLEGEKILDIACGGAHTVAISSEHKVFGWGSNVGGQIGHGMRQVFPEPQEVPLGDPITKASAGWMCTVYVTKEAKSIICGGVNSEGPSDVSALKKDAEEEGAKNDAEKEAVSNEQQQAQLLAKLSGGADLSADCVVACAVGEAHGLLVKESGELLGWGYNRLQQCLGEQSADTFVKKPTTLKTIDFSQYKGRTVGCGGAQSYALLGLKTS